MLKKLVEWVRKLFKKETQSPIRLSAAFNETLLWSSYQSDAVLIVLERILVEWPEIRTKLTLAYNRGASIEEIESIRKRIVQLSTIANNFVGVHLMAMATFLNVGEPSSLYVDDLLTYKFDTGKLDIRTLLAEELVALEDMCLRILKHLDPNAYERYSNVRLKDKHGLPVY